MLGVDPATGQIVVGIATASAAAFGAWAVLRGRKVDGTMAGTQWLVAELRRDAADARTIAERAEAAVADCERHRIEDRATIARLEREIASLRRRLDEDEGEMDR